MTVGKEKEYSVFCSWNNVNILRDLEIALYFNDLSLSQLWN